LLESAAILRYLNAIVPGPSIIATDPFRHAIEEMFASLGSALSVAGYKMIQNRDRPARASLAFDVDQAFARIDVFLARHSASGPWLFERFGWAETLLTPVLKRLWFLEYYDDYAIPERFARLHVWRTACLAHDATQDHGFEEIVKLYHDYSRGVGGGRIPDGRRKSSFTLDPHWSRRPMPPRDKWDAPPTDAQLGLETAAC